jgi:hypothetical protein
MGKEFTEKELEIQLIMAAHSLLREWLRGDDITEYIENPRAEKMIIEVQPNWKMWTIRRNG